MSLPEPDLFELVLQRVNALRSEGLEHSHALNRAMLERSCVDWLPSWGNDLHVVIYGDFSPPPTDLVFPRLGITVHSQKLVETIARSALCALKATVHLQEKTLQGLIDASHRINTLLGVWTLVTWGQTTCDWWSLVTHGHGAGSMDNFENSEVYCALETVAGMQKCVRQRIDAALYWIRAPRALVKESYRRDCLRTYACYWNAFECLVEAAVIEQPQQKLSKSEKNKQIEAIIRAGGDRVTVELIEKCYREIVNPGFRSKASYALEICLGSDAGDYVRECFELQDIKNQLYTIRNDINHGEIDGENFDEHSRIESRRHKLWMMVWRMFGHFIPFSRPIENASEHGTAK